MEDTPPGAEKFHDFALSMGVIDQLRRRGL